jgi:hypothetical protein
MAGTATEGKKSQRRRKISVELEEWLHSDRKKTIGDPVDTLGLAASPYCSSC